MCYAFLVICSVRSVSVWVSTLVMSTHYLKNNVIFLCVLDITGMPTSVAPSKLCSSNTSDLLKPDVVIHKINFITSQVYFPI